FEGLDAFVDFMREERPLTETRHDLRAVVVGEGGERAAVRGRLLDADGDPVFEFSDHFELADGRLRRLDTYTR
ncbi:MAG: ketosteroid isomerase, partial [Natrialbaceae archaeon]